MNQQLTYIIADDDPIYREITVQQLSIIPGLQCIAVCESAIEVMQELKNRTVDLLILDIEMPGLTGIQLAKSLTNLPMIIFISSHAHYAADAFEVDAIDYLVKPATQERMLRAIDKASGLLDLKNQIGTSEPIKIENEDSFFIRDKQAFVRIRYEEVLYIQSLGDFVQVFLNSGEKKIALVSLKNLELQLPSHNFIRISRTNIVNKNKIKAIDNNSISINNLQLQIGKTYSEQVLNSVLGNAAVKRFL